MNLEETIQSPARKAKLKYLACLFCGKSQYLSSLTEKSFKSIEPLEWKILQVRQQHPGRGKGHGGKGFTLIPEECLSIMEMAKDPEYRELVELIKYRLVKIVRAYLSAGLIKKEDLIKE